jgi:hypothetical protein
LAEPIVEGGFVCPVRFGQLQEQKEVLLKVLRPLTAGLLDSFGIPDKYLRSELVSGNPYQVIFIQFRTFWTEPENVS